MSIRTPTGNVDDNFSRFYTRIYGEGSRSVNRQHFESASCYERGTFALRDRAAGNTIVRVPIVHAVRGVHAFVMIIVFILQNTMGLRPRVIVVGVVFLRRGVIGAGLLLGRREVRIAAAVSVRRRVPRAVTLSIFVIVIQVTMVVRGLSRGRIAIQIRQVREIREGFQAAVGQQ